MADQIGVLVLPPSEEGMCSIDQTVTLLSTATEWRTEYAMANIVQACAEAVTTPAFP